VTRRGSSAAIEWFRSNRRLVIKEVVMLSWLPPTRRLGSSSFEGNQMISWWIDHCSFSHWILSQVGITNQDCSQTLATQKKWDSYFKIHSNINIILRDIIWFYFIYWKWDLVYFTSPRFRHFNSILAERTKAISFLVQPHFS
jgi:hypothetical protein